jgi:hypothetical protein
VNNTLSTAPPTLASPASSFQNWGAVGCFTSFQGNINRTIIKKQNDKYVAPCHDQQATQAALQNERRMMKV